MADFNGAVVAPFPVSSGVFNANNGDVIAPFPEASGSMSIAAVFDGAVDAPFPEASGEMLIGSVFAGAVVAPFPIVTGSMGHGWTGAVLAPFPEIHAVTVATVPTFDGAIVAPFPIASGAFGIRISGTNTVLVMNLGNKVVSLYENFNFNSACRLNGVYLGAASDGIHILIGADDNGAHINSSITLGDSDFGLPNIKMIPEMFINYSGDGLEVFVARDQKAEMGAADNEETGPYPVPATAEGKTQTKRANLPQGFRAGHWQFRVQNVDGGAFNIQSIEIPVEKSQRRLN
jgi:hypothetical protein